MKKNLFTVLISFSDHLEGIGQYETDSPEKALEMFILESESLEGYDRQQLLKAINPLIHIKPELGLWIVSFNNARSIGGPDDNLVLGGHIVQTDPTAPTRE